MALSGIIPKDVGPYNRLQLEWSGVQDEAANTTRITARLYWMADRSGVGAVYATSYNPVSITINGNTETATAQPKLSAGQKKLILTHAVTVPHDPDGEKQVTISGYFDVEATLSGTYYGRQSVSRLETLNPIARASSLSSSPSFTAGKQFTVSIKRASSAFRHIVNMYVKNRSGSWVFVNGMEFSTSQTSLSSGFTTGEIELIFATLDGRASADTRIVVDTWSGDKFIGGSAHEGTVTAPLASYTESPASFNIGSAFEVRVLWYNSAFVHTVRLKNGSTILKSYSGLPGSFTFDTASIADTLYGLTPSSNSLALTLEVLTYYGSELVRSSRTEAITAKVTGSNPTFAAAPPYLDTNAATVTITGNNQSIISNKSTVRATITPENRATANNRAAMVQYIATLGGQTLTKPWSSVADVVFDFAPIDAKTNQALVIRAVDTRGNSTIVSRTVSIIPYDPPGISVSASRINGFEADTVMKLSGTLSELRIDGVPKNSLKSAKYRTKESASTAWSTYSTFAVTGFPTFTATDQVKILDNTKSYTVEFVVEDQLGSTTILRTVPTGKPLMFWDDRLNSIGAGDYPQNPNEFLMAVKLRFGGNKWGPADAGMDMNNAGIVGANGIYFRDTADANVEGLMYLREGAPLGSTDPADYHNFRVRDGAAYLDGFPIALNQIEVQWSGHSFLHDGATIPLKRTMQSCPNGLILLWSRYVNAAPAASDWNVTVIPKHYSNVSLGTGLWCPLVATGVSATVPTMCYKYIYPRNDHLTGNARNSTGTESGQVLRHVLSF